MISKEMIAGVDEAGRGPLAGPVVAAAVIIPENKKIPEKIQDSKKMSEKDREEMYQYIINEYIYGIGIVSEKVIDKINILQATFQAMAEAVTNLKVKPKKCLIDGNQRNHLIKIPQETIVKGDQKVKQISAASIIAKVTRDRIMVKFHKNFPEYNFIQNKGYGTQEHIEAILKYGYSKVHRKSFSVYQEQRLF